RIKQLIKREMAYNSAFSDMMTNNRWPFVAQFTSMGSQKDNEGGNDWIAKELAVAFGMDESDVVVEKDNVKIVIPTVEEMANGLLGYSSGSCTPIPSKSLLN